VLYAYALGYLVAPGALSSAHVVAFVAGLPAAVKLAGKAVLAAPFAFHSLNGLRHLGWDMGYCASAFCRAKGDSGADARGSPVAQGRLPLRLRRPRRDRRVDDRAPVHVERLVHGMTQCFVRLPPCTPGRVCCASTRSDV
jgi:hypothetical protein